MQDYWTLVQYAGSEKLRRRGDFGVYSEASKPLPATFCANRGNLRAKCRFSELFR